MKISDRVREDPRISSQTDTAVEITVIIFIPYYAACLPE